MKSLVFDTGPVISITMNNLLWTLPHLKKQLRGNFYICETVKKELVDKPLSTKKFKFEALQTLRLINKGIFQVIPEQKLESSHLELMRLANNIYSAKRHPITIVHHGEMESVAAALHLESSALVVDERTTRNLLEDPLSLKEILEKKLHTPVTINVELLRKFKRLTKPVKIIRSFELVVVSYEIGLLDKYLPSTSHPNRTLLEAVLWAVKLDGCAVSQAEINKVVQAETRR